MQFDEKVVDVLLVDDNPDDTDLTLRALRRVAAGLRVRHAGDGAAAGDMLARLGAARALPRFVLLDLKLPLVDGFEVLRRIRGEPRTCVLPVVVLTSSCEESDVRRSYQLGANSYLTKPVDFDRYMEVVSAAGAYWGRFNVVPSGFG